MFINDRKPLFPYLFFLTDGAIIGFIVAGIVFTLILAITIVACRRKVVVLVSCLAFGISSVLLPRYCAQVSCRPLSADFEKQVGLPRAFPTELLVAFG